MSVSTYFFSVPDSNSDDPPSLDDCESLRDSGAITETEDEYGGWIIDISKLPPGTGRIYVVRF